MTEVKDKTVDAKAEKTKAPELSENDMLKLVANMSEEKKAQFRDVLGLPPLKPEGKDSGHAPEGEKGREHGDEGDMAQRIQNMSEDDKARMREALGHGKPEAVPEIAATTEAEEHPAALTGKQKLATAATVVGLSAAAAAAANSAQVLTPIGLATSPAALATYTWLQGAVNTIPWLGPLIPAMGTTLGTLALVPVVGAGLGVLGKAVNMGMRFFNAEHKSTGLDPLQNIKYGAKVATFPLWGTWEALKWTYNKVAPIVTTPASAAWEWTKANTDTLAKGAGVGILVGTALGMAVGWPPFGVLAAVAAGGSYIAQNARHGQAHGNGKKNGGGETPHEVAAPAAAHAEPHPEPAH